MRRFLVAAMCLVLSCACWAQTAADAPASKEDVEKYLQAVHSHEMMKQMVVAMAKPMHQMVHDQYEKNKDKLPADFEARMNTIQDDMMREMPWDDMIDAMVPSYQKHFTKGDMEALTAFYSAPTGQKILREMPAIMADAMESMQPILRKSIERMTERLQDQMAQMMKGSTKSGPDASPVRN